MINRICRCKNNEDNFNCGSNGSKQITADTTIKAAETTQLEKLVVGASSTPHGEILEQVKDELKEQGYELEIVIFDDYVLPNTSLDEGSLDANYFQHTPYLDSFNASNNTDIVSAAAIHYEPFGLYGNGVASVADAAEGANAADDVTTLDIVDDKGFDIIAVQADTVAAQYTNSNSGSLAVINGNYVLAAGLDVSNALAVENPSGNAAQTYANIVAVRSGDKDSEQTTALVNALKTDEVRTYIEETYDGAVVAIF